MNIIKVILQVWLLGWIVSSTAYCYSSVKKSRHSGDSWSIKQSLPFISLLLVVWPLSAFVYFYLALTQKAKH
ncbi:hypothetical protein QUF75_07215 [Desulfococcaceae bacterium HSG7]|nr:hypothetical protein [Desulfococcaceae bacterium HSG7]